jgi:hypothetical protein
LNLVFNDAGALSKSFVTGKAKFALAQLAGHYDACSLSSEAGFFFWLSGSGKRCLKICTFLDDFICHEPALG